MAVVRVDAPLGRDHLDRLAAEGSLAVQPAAPLPAYAVTTALRSGRPG